MDIPVDGTLASDETLMLAWAAGDLPSFEQLYARHQAGLYRFIRRLLQDEGLSPLTYEDVCLALFEEFERSRADEPVVVRTFERLRERASATG